LTFYYFAESYINFNDLVTDLFKVYKTRIWMSAINPASFATAAGTLTHIPPPSAIGPGATAPLGGSVTGPLPVGLGFGREAFRVNEQFGTGMSSPNCPSVNSIALVNSLIVRPSPSAEASRDTGPYYPFANQIPQFPVHPQPQYGMTGGWTQPVQQPQQQQYNRYNPYAGGYTPATYPSPAQGLTSMASPMNAPSYYPPTTYPSSPVPGMTSSSATRPYDSHDSNWVNQFQNMSFQPQK
jgi:PSP1 C-terminal conserved region